MEQKFQSRISFAEPIAGQKISDLLVIDLDHLNSDMIVDCALSPLRKLEQVAQGPVVHTLALFSNIPGSRLQEYISALIIPSVAKNLRALSRKYSEKIAPAYLLPSCTFSRILFGRTQICRR